MPKPLVLVTAENLASNRMTRPILTRHRENIAQVMIVPNLAVSNGKQRGRAQSMIGRSSLWFLAFKVIEIFVYDVLAWLRGQTIQQQCKRLGIACVRYQSASSDAFVAALTGLAPDYLVNTGPAILLKRVLGAPKIMTLNGHGARLPEYSGAANYVWVLHNGDAVAYTTIQQMELAIDAGPVLREASMPVDPGWSSYRFNYELSIVGGELYAQTISELLSGKTLPPIVRPEAVRVNRGLPSREAIREFHARGKKLWRWREIFYCI